MRVLTVTSGKGGTGKTTMACNLAVALSQGGQSVVLFDADLQLANVDVALGLQPEFGLQHVVSEEKTLREVLVQAPGGFRVVSGGSAIPTLMNAGPKRLGAFFSQLSSLARDTDILMFDTSAGLDSKVVSFLKLGQEIILVTTPDPTSVTDAYATIKVAFRRCENPRIRVLVNQVSCEREGRQVFEALAAITSSYLKQEIEYLGSVRQDFQAGMAAKKRRPFMLTAPNAWCSEDTRDIASQLRAESVGKAA